LIEYLEKQLLKKNPPVFYYAQLSSLYLNDERPDEAKAILLSALSSYPDDGRLRTVLGYLHLQQEKYEEAYSGQSPLSPQAVIDLLKSFHRLSPKAVEALYYLTLLQAEEKEYEAALGNARRFELLAQDQGKTNLLDGFFYYQYATLHERTGQLEEAEKLFFKAIELGDTALSASAQNYIAYMWAERGEKLEFSLTLIEQALAADPNNAAFIDTLGWIYYMQGRYEEALAQLKTASELFSDDSTIWEHLGDTYLKLGNPTAAREHWEKALELSPEAEHLNQRIEENTP